MTLIETIEHVKGVIEKNDFSCEECKKEHEELLGFLLELNRYRNNQSVDAVLASDAVQCKLAQENDALKQKVAALCQERDALQRRCDDLEKSRQAWVMKCDALTGQLQETMEEREKLKGLSEDYLKAFYQLSEEYADFARHPWQNLWRHIKGALGIV